ncbi:MAG: tetratricopeptide repeat protein [Bacteroidales bacterium]|jgi:cytochrome c-type biogenesis protein CcmH/NrfG|nr:tetratricopeptide repeat protein [Bacteroidales bacterium]
METLVNIEKTLAEGRVEEAFIALQDFLKAEPNSAKGWYLLGGIYRRQQMWGEAINSYGKAKMIEPDGPADAAIESIYDIIRFVNKDLMNP